MDLTTEKRLCSQAGTNLSATSLHVDTTLKNYNSLFVLVQECLSVFWVWVDGFLDRHHAAYVPVAEHQSVKSRGVRRVLWAVSSCRLSERFVVVLDSDDVHKGVMERSEKWQRHGWRAPGGELGRQDLCEAILLEPHLDRGQVQISMGPVTPGAWVVGNQRVDQLANKRRDSRESEALQELSEPLSAIDWFSTDASE